MANPIKAAEIAVDATKVAKAASKVEDTAKVAIKAGEAFTVRGPDNVLYDFPAGATPQQARKYIANKLKLEPTPAPTPEAPPKLAPGWYVDDTTGEYHQVGEDGKPVPMDKNPIVREQWPDSQKEYMPSTESQKVLRTFAFDIKKELAKRNPEYKATEIMSLIKPAFKNKNDPSSLFYANLYDKLESSDATTTKVRFVNQNAFTGGDSGGYYNGVDHEIVIPERSVEAALKTDPEWLNYAISHELSHGATLRKVHYNLGLQRDVNKLMYDMQKHVIDNNIAMTQRDQYGFTNWREFLAEIYSRPMFRQVAKDAQVWNRTVLLMAGILGLGSVVEDSTMRAEFEKMLEFNTDSNGST